MATVTLHGNPVTLDGTLPQTGHAAPAFTLVNGKLEDVTLASFAGQRKVLKRRYTDLRCVSAQIQRRTKFTE